MSVQISSGPHRAVSHTAVSHAPKPTVVEEIVTRSTQMICDDGGVPPRVGTSVAIAAVAGAVNEFDRDCTPLDSAKLAEEVER
jgi:hypothetical protein